MPIDPNALHPVDEWIWYDPDQAVYYVRDGKEFLGPFGLRVEAERAVKERG